MRLPNLWAVCETCFDNAPEKAGNAPDEVYWSPKREQWLCSECFFDDGIYDPEKDVYVNEESTVSAEDTLLPIKERRERLIVAATKKRMGVK